ncbi:CBN-CYP-33C9 protein [Aphelenchoides avenae]|nr:CBN-CYP-33C9 protein [Aphelenchus avenae]
MAFLLIAIVAFFVLAFWNFYYKRRNLPPGPAPLPIIGNGHQLTPSSDWHATFSSWRKQYGDVYTFWMGELPIVTVNEYHKMVETFQKDGDSYANRLSTLDDFHELVRGGVLGVVDTWGDLWREQRRFALHVLRDFGLGKGLMQQRVLDEVATLVASVRKEAKMKDEINVAGHVDLAIGSIINSLMFGYSLHGEHEEEFHFLKKNLACFVEAFGDPFILSAMGRPKLLRHFPFFKASWDRFLGVSKTLFKFFDRQIRQHQKDIDLQSDAEPSDYVEAFLREKAKKDNSGEPHSYSIAQLKNMCFDLWIAGQETTSTTLAWGVVYLINSFDAHSRLQEELNRVIGGDRMVTLDDRAQLPYTCAVVNEIQRRCNLVPFNLLHETSRDVVIDGYRIAKGTCVIPQMSAVLFDEKVKLL